jgi:Skp family chaperone for outer membrane proteins
MMKRLLWVFPLLLPVMAAAQAASPAKPAVPPPPAAPAVPGEKFAVVNFREAMTESDPGVLAQKDYEQGMAAEKAKIDKLNKEMADLQEKLRNAKTDAEKTTLDRQMRDKDGTRASR